MYLATTARLRDAGQTAPISLLAESLSIPPISVNETCHQLQDQGLAIHRPHDGAMLAEKRDERACHILRRHRPREVFLMDKLGFDYDELHHIACQLERAAQRWLWKREQSSLQQRGLLCKNLVTHRRSSACKPRTH
jgi:DtxR family Mn-dependent transcriptional regulator